VLLVVIETILLLRRPLGFIPYPVHRRTGEPQPPNGAVVLARGRRPEQLVTAVPHHGHELSLRPG
jgi:hypothetical protein